MGKTRICFPVIPWFLLLINYENIIERIWIIALTIIPTHTYCNYLNNVPSFNNQYFHIHRHNFQRRIKP